MTGARTVTVLTLDHGDVTLPEPAWCAGHPEGPAAYRADVHHAVPVPVPDGLVDMDVELVAFPYGSVPVPVSVYVGIVVPAMTLDPDGLRDYAAGLTERAALLVELADRLAVLRTGGAW